VPGRSIPSELSFLPVDRWTVGVVVKDSCGHCREVLRDLPRVASELSSVSVVVVAESPALLDEMSSSSSVVGTAQVAEGHLGELPFPSVFLSDPHHLVQGVGRIRAAEDVLSFFQEARVHGLGPNLATSITAP
jgi:thiol-disulfide isomerase/thioredoxin